MANSDVTRKLHVYRALYRMNRAFAHLSNNLDRLTVDRDIAESITPDMPESWALQLEEAQAEINRLLTETLHNLEHGDVMRLGRVVAMAPQVRKLRYPPDKPKRKPARKKPRQ